jgi:hypothetical protein
MLTGGHLARINVFLKDELLEAIDAEAVASLVKRSALIQLALTNYLEARRKEREEAERRREMDEACRGMDALADRLGDWDPVRVIREFRENRAVGVREPRKPYRAKTGKGRT